MTKTKVKVPFALRFIPRAFPMIERLFPFLAYHFAAKIFLTPFRFKTPKSEVEFVKTGNRFQFEIANKRIVGFSWGQGKTILCIHGWSGRGSMFRKFMEPLVASGFRVVIFDGPAHGLSTGTSTDILEFEDVILKLETMFKPIVGFLTHSFGGTAALFHFSRNNNPRPVVLIAVPAWGEAVIRTFVDRINGSRKVIQKLEEITFKKYGASFYDISALKTSQALGHTPSLVIHDNSDSEVSVKHAEKLMEELSNGTFIRTTGLGHNRILRDSYTVEKTTEFLVHHCK